MTEAAIICVDDEALILESIKEQLRRQFGNHYIYETAESPAEAWEIMEDLHQDNIKIVVIVSDWLMPQIKGDEFLVQVHERYPDILTVMLTGQADKAAIARAREEANLFACLSKPWVEKDLIEIITAAIKKLH